MEIGLIIALVLLICGAIMSFLGAVVTYDNNSDFWKGLLVIGLLFIIMIIPIIWQH